MGTGSFPGVKSGRDVTLTPNPLLVPWSRKGGAIPLLPLWAVRPVQSLSACTRVHFTFTFTFTRRMGRLHCRFMVHNTRLMQCDFYVLFPALFEKYGGLYLPYPIELYMKGIVF